MKNPLIISMIIASLGLATGCDKKPETADKNSTEPAEKSENATKETAESYRPVQVLQVGAQSHHTNPVFNGIVKAGKESNLSFKVAGNIKNLTVNIGDYVTKGQRIAVLDATDYHVNFSQAIANLKNIEASKQAVYANIKQAEAELIRAQSAYRRAEKLYETNTIALSEFEQARAAWQAASASAQARQLQFSSASAQVEAAQQQAQAAKNQLTYNALLAPYSGIISQVLVEENEQVGAGQPIVLLSKNTQPDIEVGLPATMISTIQRGQPVKASFFNIPNKTYTGIIRDIGFGTANSSVYPVVIKLQQADNNIRPGMTANVTFMANKAKQAAQLVIPTTAIGEDKSGKYVYTLTPSQKTTNNANAKTLYKVNRHPIMLGELSYEGFTVLEGLQPGQLIAKAGLNVLQQGDLVTIFNEDALNNQANTAN